MCVPLTSCGHSSNAPADEKTTEVASAETSTTAHTGATTEQPVYNPDVSSNIQEKILGICPSAAISLTETGSLSIDLSECYNAAQTSYISSIVYDSVRILGIKNLGKSYSDITFSYVDEKVLSTLTITDFKDISDFSSSLICTGDDSNYIVAFNILYDKLFYNHDIENRQLINQGETADKYGIENNSATAEAKAEDDLWFYSSFDRSIPHELQESSYVINYRYDTDDMYSYGKTVGESISLATDNLKKYLSSKRDLLSFDNFIVVCFDGDSDTGFLEYTLSEGSDGNWAVSDIKFGNDNFKSGFGTEIDIASSSENQSESGTAEITESSSGNDSKQVPYSLKYGNLLDANPDGGVDMNTLIIKAKIEPSLTNRMTITQNYQNIIQMVQAGDYSQYDAIEYWAVADMSDGTEGKAISFTVSKDCIKSIADGSIATGDTLEENLTDLWILPSLQEG